MSFFVSTFIGGYDIENSKITESILNLTDIDTLKKLDFVQGGDSELYTEDGTKLTVKSDTHPTEYKKSDGLYYFCQRYYRISLPP